MKNLKKWHKITLAAAGTFLLLVLIIQAILSATIKGKLESELARQTGCQVELHKCRVSLLPPLGLTLEDLSIDNPQGEWGAKTILTLEKLNCRMKLLPLLWGKTHIKKIHLTKGSVNYEIDKDECSNLESILKNRPTPEENKKSPNINLQLDDLKLEQLKLSYTNKATGERYEINNLHQLLRLSYSSKSGKLTTGGSLSAEKIRIKRSAKTKEWNRVSLSLLHNIEANIKEKKFTIHTVTAGLNDFHLIAQGSVHGDSVDLTLSSENLTLEALQKELTHILPNMESVTSSGKAVLAATVQGQLAAPQVEGSLKLAQGSIQYDGLPKSINSVNADITFSESELLIHSLGLKLGDDPIAISGSLKDFMKPAVTAKVSAKLNLKTVEECIQLPDNYAFSGQLKTDIMTSGTISKKKQLPFTVTGTTSLDKCVFKTPELPQKLSVDGTLGFTTQQLKQNLKVTMGRSDLAYTGSIRNWQEIILPGGNSALSTVTINGNSQLLDIDELLKNNEPQEITKSKSPQSTTPKEGEVKVILQDSLPEIPLEISLTAKTVRYDSLTFSGLSIQGSLKKEKLKTSLTASLMGGSINGNIDATIRGTEIDLSSKLTINSVDANSLITHYNDKLVRSEPLFLIFRELDDGLHGKLSLQSRFTTKGSTNEDVQRNIDGQFALNLREGYISNGTLTKSLSKGIGKFLQIDEVPYRSLSANFDIKNKAVHIDTLLLDSKRAGAWKAYGSVGFDASLNISLENRLPLTVSQKITGVTKKATDNAGKALRDKIGGPLGDMAGALVAKQGIPTDDEGRVTISLSMVGHASDPQVRAVGFKEGLSLKFNTDKKGDSKFKRERELRKKRRNLEKGAIKKVEKKLNRKLSRKEKRMLKKSMPKDLKKLLK